MLVVVSVMYTCLHVCCCFGHVYMLGLHVSLLFRSCIHVRATCLHVSCCFGHVCMLGLHVSLLFRSCIC